MRTFIEKNMQTMLNHYLALDPESAQRLSVIHGKVVTIEFVNIGFVFQMLFTESEIKLKSTDLLKADTIIKGTPLSLLHMSLSRDDRKRFFAEDVTIEGDLECGQKVIDLFDSFEMDWEEYLSHWIGDVPAHQSGRFVRNLKNFSKNLHATFLQNTNEYIHEETNLCPPPEALQDFFHDIDSLRMDTDRLEARIEKLMKTMDTKKEA